MCKCTVTSTFSPMRTVFDHPIAIHTVRRETDFIRTCWVMALHRLMGMLILYSGALGCRKRNFRHRNTSVECSPPYFPICSRPLALNSDASILLKWALLGVRLPSCALLLRA